MQIYSLTGSPNHSRYRDVPEYTVRMLFAPTTAVQNTYAQ